VRTSRCLTAALASVSVASSALLAQREPVLKQIREPHDYYYREMYIPQATSGPNGAAWSPDGRELIYSMQGTLWRQEIGSTVARQLTDGPGYDYQPDWSPDGRTVAFVRYDGKAIELELLTLSTGTVAPLTTNGAVNLEPRWSPLGDRLVFVSTAFEGRWHVFVMPVEKGKAGEMRRITEDRDSHLPRYYYSVFDQYLSPTWSPDGRELILISNRGHIWGSGAFWRMGAEPGDSMRLIHDEETTWQARPDWARDGKRVVYASYAGRQRHQLWLMTADGGDPFQLTYGDFDATVPRWSPDSRRIAYVSNEGGNTSLWVVSVPGGDRSPVTPAVRHYLRPTAELTVVVTDAVSGRRADARISVTGVDGRSWTPDDALRRADDSFDRSQRPMEVGYFHAAGRATMRLPEGSYTVDVTRGLEYRPVHREVRVSAGKGTTVTAALVRLIDFPSLGWQSGDLHVHMNYAGHYLITPKRLAFQARSEDLHVVENLIVNKEQRIPDVAYFSSRPDAVSTKETLIAHGQEFHTSYWGHTALLGLGSHLVLPGYAAYVNTPAASLSPANADVLDAGHAQGAVGGYVHPFEGVPDPADTTVPLSNELPADVALGKADYMEIVAFSDHRSTAEVWYKLLNCGFRLPAGAGTDAMTNYASLRGPVGLTRVFVKSGPVLDHRRFLAALRGGRTFATNGPLLRLTIDGHDIGDDIAIPSGPRRLSVKAELRSIVPVDHLELVVNGTVIASLPMDSTHTSATATTAITVDKSSWVTLRAWSDHGTPPILDIYPFATTSPIYVTVAGAPIRSSSDAQYFVRWIDRLTAAARVHPDYHTEAERTSVLDMLARARAEFVRRGAATTAATPVDGGTPREPAAGVAR